MHKNRLVDVNVIVITCTQYATKSRLWRTEFSIEVNK